MLLNKEKETRVKFNPGLNANIGLRTTEVVKSWIKRIQGQVQI